MKISSVLSQAILSSTSVGMGIALATAIAQPAHAANFSQGICNVADVTAGPSLAKASKCENFTGNDIGFQALINKAFGLTGNTWNPLGKSDESGDPVNNIKGETFQSGNWSLSAPTSINSPFVVTVKASTFFSAYLFQGLTGVTSGTFNVAGVTTGNKGQHANLSHLSVFTSKATAIPTPALLPGLIGLGLGVLRKRQQQQQSAE